MELGKEQTVSDFGFDVATGFEQYNSNFVEPGSLGEPSHEGFRNSVIERSFEPSIEDRHDLRSSGSLQDADSKFDERSEVGSIVSNISACVDAAFSMLPLEPPKPVWSRESGLTFWRWCLHEKSMECGTVDKDTISCYASSCRAVGEFARSEEIKGQKGVRRQQHVQ